MSTAIRGHHVYMKDWNPTVGEKVFYMKDEKEEVKSFDEHAIGVYKIIAKQNNFS